MKRNIILLIILIPSAWLISYLYSLGADLGLSISLIEHMGVKEEQVLKAVLFVESVLLSIVSSLPVILIASVLGTGKPIKIAGLTLLGYFVSVSLHYYFNNTGFNYWYSVIAFSYTKVYVVLFALVFLATYYKRKKTTAGLKTSVSTP